MNILGETPARDAGQPGDNKRHRRSKAFPRVKTFLHQKIVLFFQGWSKFPRSNPTHRGLKFYSVPCDPTELLHTVPLHHPTTFIFIVTRFTSVLINLTFNQVLYLVE